MSSLSKRFQWLIYDGLWLNWWFIIDLWWILPRTHEIPNFPNLDLMMWFVDFRRMIWDYACYSWVTWIMLSFMSNVVILDVLMDCGLEGQDMWIMHDYEIYEYAFWTLWE